MKKKMKLPMRFIRIFKTTKFVKIFYTNFILKKKSVDFL